MANFDDMLAKLHNTVLADEESSTPIVVNKQRKFEIPSTYNTVIAHAGDVNSQIITFRLPLSHEGHPLNQCPYKKIKWKNLGCYAEGSNDLTVVKTDNNTFDVAWVVPSEVYTAAGTIEFSISCFDLIDSKVAFAWNTPVCSALSVGQSFSQVGEILDENFYLPAENEVLIIDEESKQITAPAGFNNSIGNYGDCGTSKVYFKIKKNIRGIDLLSEEAEIKIHVVMDSFTGVYTISKEEIYNYYAKVNNNSNVIFFSWNIPDEITQNHAQYTGSFSIAITVRDLDKQWTSHPYHNLTLGDSLLLDSGIGVLREIQHVIDGSTWIQGGGLKVVPGIVKIRTVNSGYPNDYKINKNELIAITNGEEVDIAIGESDNQLLSTAKIIFSIKRVQDTIKSYIGDNEFEIGDV